MILRKIQFSGFLYLNFVTNYDSYNATAIVLQQLEFGHQNF